MSEQTIDAKSDDLKELAAVMPSAPIAPAHAVASIALSMAMKFHDINTVQEGALYQQYKLEGKNMAPLHLDMVLDTATRLEAWLMASSERIAGMIIDAVVRDDEVEDSVDADEQEVPPSSDGANP